MEVAEKSRVSWRTVGQVTTGADKPGDKDPSRSEDDAAGLGGLIGFGCSNHPRKAGIFRGVWVLPPPSALKLGPKEAQRAGLLVKPFWLKLQKA